MLPLRPRAAPAPRCSSSLPATGLLTSCLRSVCEAAPSRASRRCLEDVAWRTSMELRHLGTLKRGSCHFQKPSSRRSALCRTSFTGMFCEFTSLPPSPRGHYSSNSVRCTLRKRQIVAISGPGLRGVVSSTILDSALREGTEVVASRTSPALVGPRVGPRLEFEALRCAMAQSELGPSNVPLKPLKNQVYKSVGQNNVFWKVTFRPPQDAPVRDIFKVPVFEERRHFHDPADAAFRRFWTS